MKEHVLEILNERIGIMEQSRVMPYQAEQVAKLEAVELVCQKYKLKRVEAEKVVSDVFNTLPKGLPFIAYKNQ